MVKFGIQHPNFTHDGEGRGIFQTIMERARYADANRVDSLWFMDHFLQIPQVGGLQEPILEAWTTISALSAVTQRIRLGTMVTGNIYRNPALLAKMGATVDVISGGRLFMGIGAGWFETEANAYGIPFYTVPERLRRLREAVQIIKGMWTTDHYSFQGRYYSVRDALCVPRPIQKPHPPILIGGGGEKVTLKLVAKYGDACNLTGGLQSVRRKLAVLREHCTAAKRDYDDILKTKLGHLIIGEDEKEVSSRVRRNRQPSLSDEQYRDRVVYGTPEQVVKKIQEFVDAGIEYLIFNLDYGNEERALTLLVKRVIPEFNS